jgi:opacity protein-like surface antigen
MKRISLAATALSLFAGSAVAADLEVPSFKAPVMPPAFSWTGCYVGGNAGGGLGQTGFNDIVGLVSPVTGFTTASTNTSGYMLGGQIGCDYQFAANWVVGVEGAASGGNITGNVNVAQPGSIPGDNANAAAKTDLLTSATARVGVTFDRWLVYGKGGAGWASNNYSIGGAFLGTPFSVTGLEDRIGWTAGGGVEWAFWENWSIKLEYNYYGFGTRSVTFIDPVNIPGGAPLNVNQNIQVVKLGVNFRIPAP